MRSPTFGELVRAHRSRHGWSLRGLGQQISFHHGYIGRVEQGIKFPERPFARLADQALSAGGEIEEAWAAHAGELSRADRLSKMTTASLGESLVLIAGEDSDLDDLHQQAEDLAVDYLSQPPSTMLPRSVALRGQLLDRLRSHRYRINQLPDVYRSLAVLQGILSYAALDLGHSEAATTHAAAAWALADRTDDDRMRMWVRGTQSLIARFEGDFDRGLSLVQDGLSYSAVGSGRLRLLAGLGQCRANLGDTEGARSVIAEAGRLRESTDDPDLASGGSFPSGIFEFSAAKQHYYAGSSLMWLPSAAAAREAAEEAGRAITLWENGPPQHRPLDDEALARVYRATAYARLHELDAAAEAVRPVLNLPKDRQISWITKRLHGLAALLDAPSVQASAEAAALRDSVRDVAG
jgi:transcriptional regulator with XRE-family HTH domain